MFKEGPEPREEEHDFGHNEENEPVAQADQNNGRVISRLVLSDGLRPPTKGRIEHRNEAGPEQPRGDVVHPKHSAKQHDEGANGAQQRPN